MDCARRCWAARAVLACAGIRGTPGGRQHGGRHRLIGRGAVLRPRLCQRRAADAALLHLHHIGRHLLLAGCDRAGHHRLPQQRRDAVRPAARTAGGLRRRRRADDRADQRLPDQLRLSADPAAVLRHPAHLAVQLCGQSQERCDQAVRRRPLRHLQRARARLVRHRRRRRRPVRPDHRRLPPGQRADELPAHQTISVPSAPRPTPRPRSSARSRPTRRRPTRPATKAAPTASRPCSPATARAQTARAPSCRPARSPSASASPRAPASSYRWSATRNRSAISGRTTPRSRPRRRSPAA